MKANDALIYLVKIEIINRKIRRYSARQNIFQGYAQL